ncbi:receptor-like protein 33 [Eucalyptus grandis]|uniref:receptor-like protein 33 n=1 Tax=Eucalyptus grandis TaxID=71139 RepID=UPI00192EAE0D|nr:receptor-like protein 33 [Eucalyptus grandis]
MYATKLMPTTVPMYKYYGDYDYSLSMNNKGIQMVYMKILDVLTAIDLSTNQFEGEIPETIGNLIGLHADNMLTGQIPSSLGNIEALESLDLSQNKLTGQVPQQLTRLNFLALFNMSHNLLSGPIPKGGQFDTFLNTSYLENAGLCGSPLSKECGDSASSPPSKEGADSRFFPGLSWQVVVIGYGAGLFVGLVIGLAFDRRNLRKSPETMPRTLVLVPGSPMAKPKSIDTRPNPLEIGPKTLVPMPESLILVPRCLAQAPKSLTYVLRSIKVNLGSSAPALRFLVVGPKNPCSYD